MPPSGLIEGSIFGMVTGYMSDLPHSSPKPNRATKVALLTTLGDTTWRMLAPSAIFVAGGIYADLHFGTRPWLTIVSVIVGLLISALLIKQQIGNIK